MTITEDRWRFATLAAITTVTAIVSSLGAPLIPEIADTYDVRLSLAQWALTSTLIAGAVATPIVGRWGNGQLRRPVLLGGLGAVLAGTLLAALPLGFAALLTGRTLQGVGLALVPLALAAARDVWSGPALVSRLSTLSVTTVAGAGVGYPATSLVAGVFGVSGAYWFGAGLVAITLELARRHLPGGGGETPPRLDLPGIVLLSSGTLTLLLAVTQGAHWGWRSPETLLVAAGGAALLLIWVAWTLVVLRRGGVPLVDLSLALRPGVAGPNLVTFSLGAGMYGLLSLVVIVVQSDPDNGFGLGDGVAIAGLILVPYSLTSVAGSRLATRVARRWNTGLLLPTGCLVFSVAMGLLAFAHTHLWQVLVVMAIGGLGSGFTFSSLPNLIVPHVPAAETGSALAFNQLLRYLGFSAGSAASVTVLDSLGGGVTGLRVSLLALAGWCLAAGLASASAPAMRLLVRRSAG